MSYIVIYNIANIILYMFWSLAVNLICERRYSWTVTLLLELASSVGCGVLTQLLPRFSGLRLAVGMLWFILAMLLLHKGRPLRTVLTSFMTIVTMMLAELISMLFLPQEATMSGQFIEMHPLPIYALYLFLNAVLISLLVVVMRTFLHRYSGTITNSRAWLLFPVFPLCQVVSAAAICTAYVNMGGISDSFVWIILIYIVSDVILFLTIRILSRNAELTMRNGILEGQVDAQSRYYEQLSGHYEDIRRMRHDIDNHLYTMQALLHAGKYEEAADYTRQVTESDPAREHFPACFNTAAAAYLEKKTTDLAAEGIPVRTDIHIPAGLSVSNPDLICVMANLLDNARDAVAGRDGAGIDLRIGWKEPYLSIVCENPVAPEESPQSKKRRIPELERGAGLTILSRLAGKYDGHFETTTADGAFRASMVLKGELT